ncbi:MAG TPA: WYL domain-containing protein, partial [Gammaproteobacteria bacterium]|nr:WYL domain-containing protein [Gammaproteobacteria bacterium]
LSHALLRRRRLRIQHLNRRTAERTRRVVSPQRLAHYRDNWYLDSWCHLRKDLRSFAVDAIEAAELLPDDHAKDVSETKLDRVLGTGYGIFSGEHARNAVLRFSPSAARWVSQEQWHSRQEGCFDEAGYYQLTVPYTNATELVMDILRHGPNVEVLQPISLRQHVEDQLAETTRLYFHAPSRQLP